MHRHLLSALLLALALPLNAQVVVNEVFSGTPDLIELRNLGATPADVSGWTVQTYQGLSGTLAAEAAFTFPPGSIIGADGLLTLVEFGTAGAPSNQGPCSISTGFNYNWTSTRNIVVVILDDQGAGQDYFYRNINGPAGTPNLPAGVLWSGTLSGSGDVMARNVDVDTNSAADFSVGGGSATPCAFNPGQNVPPPPISLSLTTGGTGNLALAIATNPGQANAEFFHLVSLEALNPAGSGPIFGLGFDVLPQFAAPLIPGSPLHGRLNAAGSYDFLAPNGSLPPGLRLQTVAVVITASGSLLVSTVADTTF